LVSDKFIDKKLRFVELKKLGPFPLRRGVVRWFLDTLLLFYWLLPLLLLWDLLLGVIGGFELLPFLSMFIRGPLCFKKKDSVDSVKIFKFLSLLLLGIRFFLDAVGNEILHIWGFLQFFVDCGTLLPLNGSSFSLVV